MRRAGAVVGRFFEEVRPLILPGVSTWDLEALRRPVHRPERRAKRLQGIHGVPGAPLHLHQRGGGARDPVEGPGRPGGRHPEHRFRDRPGGILRGFGDDLSRGGGERRFLHGFSPRRNGRSRRGSTRCGPGNRLGDVSAAVQETVEAEGFSVVRDFVGHGIGRSLHEDPQIPNFGKRGVGPKLMPGMILAIEPMVNAGGWPVEVLADGWTVVTRDRSRSAHFEHTVAVTEDGHQNIKSSLTIIVRFTRM